jgi:hypothetical protein
LITERNLERVLALVALTIFVTALSTQFSLTELFVDGWIAKYLNNLRTPIIDV